MPPSTLKQTNLLFQTNKKKQIYKQKKTNLLFQKNNIFIFQINGISIVPSPTINFHKSIR